VTKLSHAFLLVGTAGAVLAPVSLGSTRAPAPTTTQSPCRTTSPVLLRSGAGPRQKLRVDLSALAKQTAHQLEVEQSTTRTKTTNGLQKVSTTQKLTGVVRAGAITSGRVHLSAHFHEKVTNSVNDRAPSDSFTVNGYIDALNGGTWGTVKGKGGTPVNDHLPLAAVGVGASWRVVNCEPIDGTPAKETRIYVLHSVANGVVSASYTDDIEIDGAHVDLGTEKVNGAKLHVKLVALHGSAHGTLRLPLESGFKERMQTVTHLTASVQVTTNSTPGPIVSTRLVDTDTQYPAT
jgi:hypothetical protein